MANTLTQMLLNPQQIGDALTLFYEISDFTNILDSCGITKRSGASALKHIDYLMRLKLNKISAHRNQGKTQIIDNQGISYDASQRFKNREANDWVEFTIKFAKKLDILLNGDDTDLDPELPGGIFITDDTPFKRQKTKKAEAVSYNFDHCEMRHFMGYRGSGLMYYRNSNLIPVSFIPVAKEDDAKIIGPLPEEAEPDSPAHLRRMLTLSSLPETFLKQLDMAIEAGF